MAYSWGYVIPPDVYALLQAFEYDVSYWTFNKGNYYAVSVPQDVLDFLDANGEGISLTQIESNLWPYGG